MGKMPPTARITSVVIVIVVVAQSIGATHTSSSSSAQAQQLPASESAPAQSGEQSRDLANEEREQAGRLFVQVSEQQKYQIVGAEPSSAETSTVPTTTTTTTTTSTTTTTTTLATTTRESIIGECKLGNETYQVGDKWNPDLPPHGIQVCVLCECIGYLRRAKVTCRRTAKDCPQIDSCPFGEKPVAPPGQCCKVCLSHNILGEGPARPPSVPMSSGGQPHWYTEGSQPATHKQTGGQQSPRNATTTELQNNATLVNGSGGQPSASPPPRRANKPKLSGLRPSNKELNTKDSKLAFKSLEARNKFLSTGDEQSGPTNSTSDKDSSTTSAASGGEPSVCKLGNDTYTIGDSWKPNLPPFGVQVCVLCECVARLRKSCYEAKVTCRRIANECPVIESCPDGKAPMTAPGQCCKSCPSSESTTELPITTTTSAEGATTAANASESMPTPAPANGTRESTSDATTLKRSERDFSFRDLPLCKRDGSDVSISKRSRGSTAAKAKKGSRKSEGTKKARQKKQKDLDRTNDRAKSK